MNRNRLHLGWIIVGTIILLVVILVSVYPHVLTSLSPLQREYADYQTGQSAPFPPSKAHPFGTDQWGRDLLALTLAGTFNTLIPAVVITVLVVVLSIALAVAATAKQGGAWGNVLNSVGGSFASVPVLFILILAMNQRNLHSPHQQLQYIAWIIVLEIGRGALAFYESAVSWFKMDFVESAIAIGYRRSGLLFTQLRRWLIQFSVEYAFMEFARVLSLMTMLATFHIYAVERLSSIPFFISYPPIKGIQSAQVSWISLIGDSTNNAAFIAYPYFLYAPVVALLLTVIGANLIAKGIRGKFTSVHESV